MLKHHIVWHPEREHAFHAVTAVAAKALACRDTAQEWPQLLVDGWRISMVEDEPGPVLPAHE